MSLKCYSGCILIILLSSFISLAVSDIGETVYTVSLSPNQVVDQPVLPENENSYGTGFCKLDRYSKPPQLTCSIQHNVDEVLNVTINRGQRGKNGAALYVFPVQGFFLQKTWSLTSQNNVSISDQIDDFLDGLWYVEIITIDFPSGQIRGQIEHKDRFYSYLIPQNTIPRSSGSQAHGVAVGTLVVSNLHQLSMSVVNDVTLATSIDLGAGAAGVSGSIAASVTPANSPDFPVVTLTISETSYIYQDLLFLSIASQSNPYGDIRGQLIAIDYVTYPTHIARLDGKQAKTTSNSVGSGIFSYNCDLNVLEYVIIHTVAAADSAYINSGATGSVDTVLFPLPSGDSPIYGSINLSSEEEGLLFNNLLFVGIYTGSGSDTSSGIIRGQIVDNDWQYFAYLSGTNVVPPVSTSSTGILLLDLIKDGSDYSLDYELLHTVEEAFSAAIYYGSQYENGKKLIDLQSAQSPTKFSITLTKDEYNAILSQTSYLLIESSSYLFGIVRGQILPLLSCDDGVSVPSYPITQSLQTSEVNFLQSTNDVIVVYLNSSSSLVPSLYLFFILFAIYFY